MLEPLAVDGLLTRAALRVAGEPVIEQQIELAIAAGVGRVLLLADRRTIGVDDAVALASEAKIDVRVIADAPALCSEVTAADELLVFGDALLVDPVMALPLLQSSGIVTLPIEEGLAAGFERVDAECAWGGIMVIPGALAERLRQLPRDCDVASSLLRIALMAGVTIRSAPAQALAEKRWVIVHNEQQADEIEAHRLKLSLVAARGRTPGSRLAGLIVGRFGNRLFEAERSPLLVWWGALLPVLAVLGFGVFSMFSAAFVALGVAFVTVLGAMILENAEKQGRIAAAMPDKKPLYAHLALDLILLILLGLALTHWSLGERFGVLRPWYAAVVLVALLRIGAAQFPLALARPFLDDRFSLCILLALATAFSVQGLFVMVLTMGLMAGWAAFLAFATTRAEN